ncbi:MAG: hypothetical protein LZF86_200018 [Nitrospira sp.]|nr:MAG: hypothetical protein LZF86_200018 [Nitrospira sp.]
MRGPFARPALFRSLGRTDKTVVAKRAPQPLSHKPAKFHFLLQNQNQALRIHKHQQIVFDNQRARLIAEIDAILRAPIGIPAWSRDDLGQPIDNTFLIVRPQPHLGSIRNSDPRCTGLDRGALRLRHDIPFQ